MNIVRGLLVIAVAVAVAVTAMRWSPPGAGGGLFADGDRAAGVFGVLATGFSVLFGFIVSLAFTSYDQSRSGAETEALAPHAAGRERPVTSRGPRVRKLTAEVVGTGAR